MYELRGTRAQLGRVGCPPAQGKLAVCGEATKQVLQIRVGLRGRGAKAAAGTGWQERLLPLPPVGI